MPVTMEQFGKGMVAAGLATVDELRAVWAALPADKRPKDPQQFAQILRAQQKLTEYQAQVLLQGKASALSFGNYVLLSQLGVGASGHVFRAKHKMSGREVAIKVLAASVAQNEKSVKRFHREVQATAKLAHPNIVRAVDAGEINGQHYMVMEFVDGEDLSSRVKKQGPLDVKTAVQCLLHAGRGLEYAHAQGIIHRDIKPGNMLCDRAGTVRLLDLGLVRFEDSGEATGDGLTGTQQVMGTIDYMAPEQVLDTRHADARCDIYSLGCTLFYLLTGRKAYEGKGVVDRIMQHRTAEIPSLVKLGSGVPDDVDRIFRKMVSKKPVDRYQTMTQVCTAFERFLKGEPFLDEPVAAPTEILPTAEEVLAVVEAADDVSLTNLPMVQAAAVPAGSGFGGFAVSTTPASPPGLRPAAVKAAASGGKRKLDKRLLVGGGAAAAVVLIVVAVWLALK